MSYNILDDLNEKKERAERLYGEHVKMIHDHQTMFTRFSELGIEPWMNLTDRDLNISFAGTYGLMKDVWAELRRNGFTPDRMVPTDDPKMTNFHCWFHKEGYGPVWFNFTSTVCKRVQVGTKMEEVPIYDVVCE